MEVASLNVSDPRRHLFVAAGGGGDVLAASILQRSLYGQIDALPFIVTYSWDRLMIDPLPGPRDPSWFTGLEEFGDHNYVVSEHSCVRSPGNSLLPRLARELRTKFYLLDPTGAARRIRLQLAELVQSLEIQRVSLVDSGGDILASGDEAELRSPMADSLTLASADEIGAPVDILVTGAGLDGELSNSRVCEIVDDVGGERACGHITRDDVKWYMPVLDWHPSEVNGLLIAAALGYEGIVEIRDAGFKVPVDRTAAAIHRCEYDAAIAHNALAKAMMESDDLPEAEGAMLDHQHHSEIDYQRNKASQYNRRHVVPRRYDERIQTLLRYGMSRTGQVDALSLRRAAEIMKITRDELEMLGPKLGARCPDSYQPPLWMLNPPPDRSIFAR